MKLLSVYCFWGTLKLLRDVVSTRVEARVHWKTKIRTIEDNVWLGKFVAMLPSVAIGTGSIIGTMSVFTKDIPANSIALGSPAKVVETYNFKTAGWRSV